MEVEYLQSTSLSLSLRFGLSWQKGVEMEMGTEMNHGVIDCTGGCMEYCGDGMHLEL